MNPLEHQISHYTDNDKEDSWTIAAIKAALMIGGVYGGIYLALSML